MKLISLYTLLKSIKYDCLILTYYRINVVYSLKEILEILRAFDSHNFKTLWNLSSHRLRHTTTRRFE